MPDFFVSADWSRYERKRSVHVADLRERRIWREERADWSLPALLTLARELAGRGSVLVGIDAALGVPRSYWAEVRRRDGPSPPADWVDWLRRLDPDSGFFEPVGESSSWRVDRPFFRVPPREGGRSAFTDRFEDDLLRRVDRCTGAKPLFIVSGIPGTVGWGTASLWRELISLLSVSRREFAVWPFEGLLPTLLSHPRVALAETYPGLAYAAALADELPAPRLPIAKKKESNARANACDRLRNARWVRQASVDLGDLGPARADEDAFDSHLTAAAVLRCAIEKRPLCASEWIDAEAEGAMLLAGPVDPAVRSRGRVARPPAGTQDYPCPIPGCEKIFHGARSGWDAHVASPGKHPDWHPALTDPAERKGRFREEFKDWFRR